MSRSNYVLSFSFYFSFFIQLGVILLHAHVCVCVCVFTSWFHPMSLGYLVSGHLSREYGLHLMEWSLNQILVGCFYSLCATIALAYFTGRVSS